MPDIEFLIQGLSFYMRGGDAVNLTNKERISETIRSSRTENL